MPTHWLFILLIVLIIFGAGKLPNVMGDLGRGVKEFKKAQQEDDRPAAAPAAPVASAMVTSAVAPAQAPTQAPASGAQPNPPAGNGVLRAAEPSARA